MNPNSIFIRGCSLLIFCMLSLAASAQVTQKWLKTHRVNSSPADAIVDPQAMQVDASGNLYLVGYTTSANGIKTNYLTLSYKSDGTLNWSNNYAFDQNTYFHSYSWIDISLYPDIFLAAGNLESTFYMRQHKFSTGDTTGAPNIQVFGHFDASDDVYQHVGGIKVNTSDTSIYVIFDQRASDKDYGVISVFRYDRQLLDTTVSATHWNMDLIDSLKRYYTVNGISVNPNEDLFFVASVVHSSPDSSYSDIITYRINHDGQYRWAKTYNISTDPKRQLTATAIQADDSGNVYVAANTSQDGIVVKYDKDGNVVWDLKLSDLGLSATDFNIRALAKDTSGNIILTGKAVETWNYALTVKITPDGQVLWAKALRPDSTRDYEARLLTIDPQNNIFISGLVESSTSAAIFISKYNRHGRLLWQNEVSNGVFDDPISLARDLNGNILVAGNSYDSNFESEILTAKLNQKLHAAFKVENVDCQRKLSFGNYSSAPKGEMQYIWYFGDGDSSTDENPVHIYDTGTYIVNLITTDENGKKAYATDTIKVLPGAVNSFTASNACLGSIVTMINSSTGTAYSWDFGDGRTAMGKTPTIIYDTAGMYTIELTVKGENGCEVKAQQEITIFPLPLAKFTVQHLNDLKYSFQAKDQELSKYVWSIDDTTLIGASAEYIFPGEGNYTVTLTATSADSCSVTWDTTLDIKITTMLLSKATGGIHIYPNPAHNIITVILPETSSHAQIQMLDMHGRAVRTWKVNEPQVQFDISGVAPGFYILSTQTSEGLFKQGLEVRK